MTREDNTPEDVVECMDILEEFWDVFAWNMAEMTTIKDEQFKTQLQTLRLFYDSSTNCHMLKRKSWQSKWKNVKRLDSLDL
jgi:CMP-N-acetylneuraminic acid synthetase